MSDGNWTIEHPPFYELAMHPLFWIVLIISIFAMIIIIILVWGEKNES